MYSIPNYQPIPLPIPLWLIEVLLILGFFLHAFPMGVMLSGGAISGLLQLFGKDAFARRYGKQLAYAVPLFVSFAITQGIVPLLFLQLEYGPLYYTSSILMAVPWISVLVILMIAYYGFYIFKYKSEKLGKFGPALLIGLTGLLTVIGFVFTSNMTTMLTPQHWQATLQSHPHGLYLNTTEPTIWPRYAFFWFEAFVIGGLTAGCYGLFYKKRDADYSNWLIKLGAKIFIPALLLQVVAGYFWLQAIPADVTQRLITAQFGQNWSVLIAVALLVIALLAQLRLLIKPSARLFVVALTTSALAVLDVAVFRHLLRVAYTQPFIHPETLPVSWQWDLLIPFLILAVGLIIYLVWLIRETYISFLPRST